MASDSKDPNSKQFPEYTEHGVVPDVIKRTPPAVLKVYFRTGVSANLGNVLTPTQVKYEPTVSWEPVPDMFYLLCMTDPDAPNRDKPMMREVQHWLVGNIPGNNVSKGDVLTEYIGSGPPKDSGLHRYVFVLYQQEEKIKFTQTKILNNSLEARINTHAQGMADKYNLGNPVAANFYLAQWDEYVPILHSKLRKQ